MKILLSCKILPASKTLFDAEPTLSLTGDSLALTTSLGDLVRRTPV